jgi:hypothetical protein
VARFGVGRVIVPAATVAMLVFPTAHIITAITLPPAIRTLGGSGEHSIYYNILATKLVVKLPMYTAEGITKADLLLVFVEALIGLFVASVVKLVTIRISDVTQVVTASATKDTQWATKDTQWATKDTQWAYIVRW